jgi:hypothetical protein
MVGAVIIIGGALFIIAFWIALIAWRYGTRSGRHFGESDRPPISRDLALSIIRGLPRGGRGLRIVNERRLAEQLDCDRATVVTILDDLEGEQSEGSALSASTTRQCG